MLQCVEQSLKFFQGDVSHVGDPENTFAQLFLSGINDKSFFL